MMFPLPSQVIFVSVCVAGGLCGFPAIAQDPPSDFSITQTENELTILDNDHRVASYVFRDPRILRPYFANVTAPNGLQATRNHPPDPDRDRTDHDTMHPGIWMAFGDLDGVDFWRNKGRVTHVRFVTQPSAKQGRVTFVEEKQYLREDGSLVCTEEFHCTIDARDNGYLMVWDSRFESDAEFYFGDQEEMGLGFRVATALNESDGGSLTDSENRTTANTIWSNAARWCDYSGIVDGKPVGITVLCHPDNFRASWMHARDYGLVAANPFGRQAMQKGSPSRVVVKPGESLRLQYGIRIHSNQATDTASLNAAYADYLRMSEAAQPKTNLPVEKP